jgi:thiamine kinase-like enzyme
MTIQFVEIASSIVVVSLLTTVGFLVYAVKNMLRKLEIYEEWVDDFRDEIQRVHIKLKEVDDKQLFEKDDDVGFVFSEILRITDEFNKRVK